jgi:hypothetical protein
MLLEASPLKLTFVQNYSVPGVREECIFGAFGIHVLLALSNQSFESGDHDIVRTYKQSFPLSRSMKPHPFQCVRFQMTSSVSNLPSSVVHTYRFNCVSQVSSTGFKLAWQNITSERRTGERHDDQRRLSASKSTLRSEFYRLSRC